MDINDNLMRSHRAVGYNPNTDFTATYLHTLSRQPGPAPKPRMIDAAQEIAPPPERPQLSTFNNRTTRAMVSDAEVEKAILDFYFNGKTLATICRNTLCSRTAIYKWMRGQTGVAREIMRKHNITAFSGMLDREKTISQLSQRN